MSNSVTIEDSNGDTFAEFIDVIGVSEVKKAFQQSVKEGSLHKWFKGSKSKDGKPGWVNVVTGGTCASDKPGEGTPKCVSASKRASMTKAERLSASRRKKKADPGQQAKSGAAKPTYVSTDKKKKMDEAMTDYGSQTARDNDDNKAAVAARKRIYDRASEKDKNTMDARTISQQRNKVRDERMKADQNKPEVDSVGSLIQKKLKVGKFKKMNEDVKRDEYGDPIGGPKISKKQLKKNLTSNTPDEQHTTTTSEGSVSYTHLTLPTTPYV